MSFLSTDSDAGANSGMNSLSQVSYYRTVSMGRVVRLTILVCLTAVHACVYTYIHACINMHTHTHTHTHTLASSQKLPRNGLKPACLDKLIMV